MMSGDLGDNVVRGSMIILLIVFVIFLNVIIVYCYRRHTKRHIQQEMHVQIESAVSQYFALSQSK